MEEQIRKLLVELKEKENLRQNSIEEVNAKISEINDREKSELKRFTEEIEEDRKTGVYNNTTEGQLQKLIDDENVKISEKYNAQRVELNQKLEEVKKQQIEEKNDDYKKISSAIKDYHTDTILETVKAKNELEKTETERNGKLKELDEEIDKIQAEQTHLVMKNHNFMDVETTDASLQIKLLGEKIEQLKLERESINNEYASEIAKQKEYIQHCTEQRDSAGKFLGSVILSNKSIDEIEKILFERQSKEVYENTGNKEEKQVEPEEEVTVEEVQEDLQEVNTENLENKQVDEVEKTETEPVEDVETPELVTVVKEPEPTPEPNSKVVIDVEKVEPKTEPKVEPEPEPAQETAPEPEPVSKSKKFSYEFSIKGIKYDGQSIDVNNLLVWYKLYKDDIEAAIKTAIGDKEEIETFLQSSDKLIYASMLFNGSKRTYDGKLELNSQTKERLEEYYNIWDNPKGQEKSNMDIKYDLKGTSKILRFLNASLLTDEDIKDIKDNACELRNRPNVQVTGKGLWTTVKFKVLDKIETERNIKRLKQPQQQFEETNSHESFVERLNPENLEYDHTNQQVDNTKQEVETERNTLNVGR